jgi:hypothetical protein
MDLPHGKKLGNCGANYIKSILPFILFMKYSQWIYITLWYYQRGQIDGENERICYKISCLML